MADPGNKETWGIAVFSIAVIAPSPVVETPSLLLILFWRKKTRLPAVCPLLQNLRERRKNVPPLEGVAFFRFQSKKSREVFLPGRKLQQRDGRGHLKAMNCNRGQLFRPEWVSSARCNSWAKRRIIHLKIKQKLQWKKITVPTWPSLFIRVLIHFDGSVTYMLVLISF